MTKSLTCNKVLVFVDVKLHPTQALGGVSIDVLNVLHFGESFVHLQNVAQTTLCYKQNTFTELHTTSF